MVDNRRIRVLFITGGAGSVSGSEVVLANLIKRIDPDKFDVRLFSMANGGLLADLNKAIKTYYDDSDLHLFRRRVINKVRLRLGLGSRLESRLLAVHDEFRPDIWFVNSVARELVPAVDIAIKHRIPFAVYFQQLLSYYLNVEYDDLLRFTSKSEFTLGCSEPVCENLRILGSTRVHKLYGCIEPDAIAEQLTNRASYRSKLPLKDNETVVVGMSGTRYPIKGTDIFIKAANALKDENIHFLWLGPGTQTGYELYIRGCIETYQLDNISLIYPDRDEYYSYFDTIDVFFLSSREDAFPSVMLEAAYLNKYIMSFDSGGASEFLKREERGLELSSSGITYTSGMIKDVIAKGLHRKLPKPNEFDYSAEKQAKVLERILQDHFGEIDSPNNS